MDRKADLELIRRIQNQKVNKDEFGVVLNDVNQIMTKMNHMAALQFDMTKILVDGMNTAPQGSFNNQDKKVKENLLHQSQIVCTWISRQTMSPKLGNPVSRALKNRTSIQDRKAQIKRVYDQSQNNFQSLSPRSPDLSSDSFILNTNTQATQFRNPETISGSFRKRRNQTIRVL